MGLRFFLSSYLLVREGYREPQTDRPSLLTYPYITVHLSPASSRGTMSLLPLISFCCRVKVSLLGGLEGGKAFVMTGARVSILTAGGVANQYWLLLGSMPIQVDRINSLQNSLLYSGTLPILTASADSYPLSLGILHSTTTMTFGDEMRITIAFLFLS